MKLDTLIKDLDAARIGHEIHQIVAELYPIPTSLTGDGFRKILQFVGRRVPLEMHEVPTGTPVFDWTVPREWNIRDAYVKNSKGEKVIDFKESNLHVVGYSVPVTARVTLTELKKHLHTLPDYPDWIPYRTSYYTEQWGFCLPHSKYTRLEEDEYEVVIDSTLEDGHLTYGECVLQGASDDEIVLHTHACHPSMCNDNLAGVALLTVLAEQLKQVWRRHTFRILFVPTTIGTITWLARNEDNLAKIRHGLVLAGIGDPGPSTYKRSRRGDAEIDRAALYVLQHSGGKYNVLDFSPYGYDERQYCSPGINLPFGCLTRTPLGQYPQYHTSADNLEFVQPDSLADTYVKVLSILSLLEDNGTFMNLNPKCEPQLGKRGLYGSIGGRQTVPDEELAKFWVLNFSDGRHSLLDIADKSGIAFSIIRDVAQALRDAKLLAPCPPAQ